MSDTVSFWWVMFWSREFTHCQDAPYATVTWDHVMQTTERNIAQELEKGFGRNGLGILAVSEVSCVVQNLFLDGSMKVRMITS